MVSGISGQIFYCKFVIIFFFKDTQFISDKASYMLHRRRHSNNIYTINKHKGAYNIGTQKNIINFVAVAQQHHNDNDYPHTSIRKLYCIKLFLILTFLLSLFY